MEILGIRCHFALSINKMENSFPSDCTGEWRAVNSIKNYFCCSGVSSLKLQTTTTSYRENIVGMQL